MRIKGYLMIMSILLITSTIGCAEPQHLTILHTNDMHAQYLPTQATWVDKKPKPMIGGMVALKYYIDQQRQNTDEVLLLDAGDIMTGTPLSNIEVEGAFCGGFVKMMNLLDYDAMTIGNHEFDGNTENLQRLLSLTNFDVLSANLFYNDQLFAPKEYKIYEIGRIKVGVIGLIMDDLFGLLAKRYQDGLNVESTIETAQKYIDKIDPQTDLIVLLTHQGYHQDSLLAASTHGADLIVGGHSHTRIPQPLKINDVLVVQTGSKVRYLGRLDLQIKNDRIEEYEGKLIPLWVEGVKNTDEEMVGLVATFKDQIDKAYGEKIGTLKTPWKKSNRYETNLGDWIADAMRDYAGTDFALINSGGIRKQMQPGPITKLDIIEILPFTNYLVKFTCTGEQLMTFIQENAEASALDTHGIMQISGLSYDYKKELAGKVLVSSATVNGQPIKPKKIYNGVSVDYVLMGQEMKYLKFKPQNLNNLGILISDVVIDYVRRNPVIDTKLQRRINNRK